MIQPITISDRLKRVASYLPAGSHFADIGSDHAYLPCFVCQHDEKAKAIAGEVVEGPYKSARATVKVYQLHDVIDVRLGDGLSIIEKDEVKQIVIAGMGGKLITSILQQGNDKLESVERLIIQPNVDAKAVRNWTYHHGYKIVQEEIVEENGHFYEIIVADKGETNRKLSEQEIMFGPLLLANKSSAFYHKWKSEQRKIQFVMNQLELASVPQTEKLARFNNELSWVKEVLQDEGDNYKS
ncbi:tRNA (adenine(22)-N(1))-methyltransferase TrmK [Virgibacillus phasianinus]|uniref:tRNA (Adenine(22)-N(1))-methyltransferase TrmK n=1 Tax=Virgibacillus phasianinus TaxID=2017483 RepID=A0A220U4Y0_9BACI|nr:class I SAM-dependent methyltransferase [Virgibacillus phasianinus]ASK63169.1 tRNA (adenine(22)-N(1))-methyltransferase TrmK [Virgibacillus phasianinus]